MDRQPHKNALSPILTLALVLTALLYFAGGWFGLPKWTAIFWVFVFVGLVAAVEIPMILFRRRRQKRQRSSGTLI